MHRPLLSALLILSCLSLSAAAQPAPAGQWLAEDIFGGGAIDRAQTTLEFTGDGRVAGRGGCNRYFGSVKIEGDKISFGQMGSTRMACVPALMDQEAKFFRALTAARSWRADEGTRKLMLLDESGTVILRLARMP